MHDTGAILSVGGSCNGVLLAVEDMSCCSIISITYSFFFNKVIGGEGVITATYWRLGPNQDVLLLYNMTFSWQRGGRLEPSSLLLFQVMLLVLFKRDNLTPVASPRTGKKD